MNKIQRKFISLSVSLPLDLSVSGGVDLIHVIGGKLMKSWRNPAGVSFLLVLIVALCGTGISQEPAQQTQEPAQQAADQPVLVVPEGTNLPIILSTFLNSRSTQVGDTFYADTTYPI